MRGIRLNQPERGGAMQQLSKPTKSEIEISMGELYSATFRGRAFGGVL